MPGYLLFLVDIPVLDLRNEFSYESRVGKVCLHLLQTHTACSVDRDPRLTQDRSSDSNRGLILTSVKWKRLFVHSLGSIFDPDDLCIRVCHLKLRQIEMMDDIRIDNVPAMDLCRRPSKSIQRTYLTGPSSLILVFVSWSRRVEASTQTPPSLNLTAVDLPPKGNMPYLANGLEER